MDIVSSNIKYTKLLVLPAALLYAFILITLIPIDAIIDRGNYLKYADYPELILLSNYESGLHVVLFNEPVFLLINLILSFFFIEENVVRTIIFFGSFTTSYLVLKYNYRYFFVLLFFLLIPQVLKNYVIHLRQGLALSFFLIGYLSTSKDKFKNTFFIFLSPLIHSSFFLIIFLIYIVKFLERVKFDFSLKIGLIILFGILSSLIMETAGRLIGARQASQYQFTSENTSGIGFLFWFFIFFIYKAQGKEFLKSSLLSISILIFYLTTYFFIPVTARIFESGIILILLSGLNLTGWRKYSFLGLIIFYAAFTYILNIASPYVGWGVT
jgi:hypothetical protein